MKSTADICRAVQTALAAVQHDGRPAFEHVALFDLLNFGDALRELVLAEERFAVVVYLTSTFEREASSPLLAGARRVVHLKVYLSDRNLADPQAAVFGDDAGTAGVLALADAALPALAARLFTGADAVELLPVSAELVELAGDNVENPHPGRKTFELTLQARGGLYQIPAARHPIR